MIYILIDTELKFDIKELQEKYQFHPNSWVIPVKIIYSEKIYETLAFIDDFDTYFIGLEDLTLPVLNLLKESLLYQYENQKNCLIFDTFGKRIFPFN